MAARRRATLGARGWLLTFVVWTCVGAFQASSWALSPGMPGYQQPARLFAVALFNAYVWALLTPPVLGWGAWAYDGRDERARRIALLVVAGMAISAVVTAAALLVHRWLIPVPAGALPDPGAWVAVWYLGRWYGQQLAQFAAIVVVAVGLEVRRVFNERERESARLQMEAVALQAQLAEARLSVLRARLNPHFLFNTLNAISALVAKNPRGVRDMIALLSELLRHALSDSKEQEIPLREELRLMRLYLEILEIRYQGQLRTAIIADANVQGALVPNLVLQPLVENAMKHGIDRAGGHGTIEVRAARVGDDLVLTVHDTGCGDDPAPPAREGGVGLRLTRERLAELYGTEQRVTLEPRPGGGMQASITLPYHTSDDLRVTDEAASS